MFLFKSNSIKFPQVCLCLKDLKKTKNHAKTHACKISLKSTQASDRYRNHTHTHTLTLANEHSFLVIPKQEDIARFNKLWVRQVNGIQFSSTSRGWSEKLRQGAAAEAAYACLMSQAMSPVEWLSCGKLATPLKLQGGAHLSRQLPQSVCQRPCCPLPK